MFLASTSEKVTRDAPNNAAPGIRKRCSAPRARRAICGATSPIKPMTPVKHIAPAAHDDAQITFAAYDFLCYALAIDRIMCALEVIRPTVHDLKALLFQIFLDMILDICDDVVTSDCYLHLLLLLFISTSYSACPHGSDDVRRNTVPHRSGWRSDRQHLHRSRRCPS